MFNFFGKYTEEDILTKFVNTTHSVLVVGPFGGYGSQEFEKSDEYGGFGNDPIIPLLIRKIKNNNLTVIDIKGGVHTPSNIFAPFEGDLYRTKETIDKLFNHSTIKYVITDALDSSFKGETFDIIIDRITHEFICLVGYKLRFRENNLDRLVYEYNRILKKGGKIIFFSRRWFMHRRVYKKLKMWDYKLIKGSMKKAKKYTIDKTMNKPFYKSRFYIVAFKV